MRSTSIFALAFAVAVSCSPALAQHGHPGGMGNSMGGAAASMGHGAADHNASTSNMSASHGQTMDQFLTRNTQLADKIQTLTGMSAQQACTGFKNLGQCVAAAHVSKNLGIGFACLKSDMTGQAPAKGSNCPAMATSATAGKTMSLGKAIQTLSPNVNSSVEAKKAQKQADQDIHQSNS
jgi:hypothetical protein